MKEPTQTVQEGLREKFTGSVFLFWLMLLPPPSPPPLAGPSVGFMMVEIFFLMILLAPSSPAGASPPCPEGCRCYSLTVECGSTGLKAPPRNIPAPTQVSEVPQTFL